jgi:hypothetical protein
MRKENEVGVLIENKIWWYTVYNIYTKSNQYRGWNVYSEMKHGYLASWSCIYMIELWWKDICTTLEVWQHFSIPAHTPNIFYFSQDSVLIESFPCTATKEKYPKYQTIKETKQPLVA